MTKYIIYTKKLEIVNTAQPNCIEIKPNSSDQQSSAPFNIKRMAPIAPIQDKQTQNDDGPPQYEDLKDNHDLILNKPIYNSTLLSIDSHWSLSSDSQPKTENNQTYKKCCTLL